MTDVERSIINDELVNIQIPNKILKKMRVNKNFANVYTPYHQMEGIDL